MKFAGKHEWKSSCRDKFIKGENLYNILSSHWKFFDEFLMK